MSADPRDLIVYKAGGDWWQDGRRNWCAYCGNPIDFSANKPGKVSATRDHVIPKAHKANGLKIPACRPCNEKRGATSLPEFLSSPYFDKVRQKKSPNAWSLRDLWLVLAYAAVQQAYLHSEEWPGKKSQNSKSG